MNNIQQKSNSTEKKINLKKYALIFFTVLGIILIFALIDYFFHRLSKEYDVPSYYFKNKIIVGTLIGFVAYLFFAKQKIWIKSLAFSATISILLQIRYYFEGYPLDFVLLFFGIHFAILIAVSCLAFKLLKKYV